MDISEVYIATVEPGEGRYEGYYVALAGDRVLSIDRRRTECVSYADGYNQALHDFLLPPSPYDEDED